MDNPLSSISFKIVINEGYSFRHLIEYLKSCDSMCIFIVSPNYIKIQQCGYDQIDFDNKNILNEIDIDIKNINYTFDGKDEISFGVNVMELNNVFIKSIQKRDVVYIEKDKNSLDLNFHIGNIKEVAKIRLQILDNIVYNKPPYYNIKEPSFIVDSNQIIKACKKIATSKADKIMMYVYYGGLKFEAKRDGNISSIITEIGECNRYIPIEKLSLDSEVKLVTKVSKTELISIKLRMSTIKSIHKMCSLIKSDNKDIHIYIEPGLPIKFIGNISTYGKINIYIKTI
jgi:hypothetical protein